MAFREEIQNMMEEADASLDEKVSFPEFERIMRPSMAFCKATEPQVGLVGVLRCDRKPSAVCCWPIFRF